MATKKSLKNKKPNSFLKKLKHHKFLTFLALILIFMTGFFIFRVCVNHYNISLLDKAEAKMRAMNVPKADHTIYRRSCSFRSVKFQSAGSPNCGVLRTDVFNNMTAVKSVATVKEFINTLRTNDVSTTTNVHNDEEIVNTLSSKIYYIHTEIPQLQKGLKCYQNIGLDTGGLINLELGHGVLPEESLNLRITTSCYRRFMFQTYPELN